MRKKSKLYLNLGFLVFTLLTITILFYYIIFPARGEYHSDFTDTIFWAEASIDAKALFNSDFTYAASLPFGGHLIMIPFVLLFGVSMKANILGMLTFSCFFILALFYLCKTMNFNFRWASLMITITLLTLSLSQKLREIFWGHIIYYSLGILFLLVGLTLIFNTLNILEKRTTNIKGWAVIIISCLWVFLCATNGLQALIIFVIPALGGVVLERYCNLEYKLFSRQNLSFFLYVTSLFIAMVLGYVIGILLIGNNIGGYAEAYSVLTPPNEWVINIEKILPHWLTLLGFNINLGNHFKSIDGIKNLLLIIFGLTIAIVPLLMLRLYKQIKDRQIRILIITHFLMTLLIMIGYIFGALSAANWRLSPLVASTIILNVVFLKWLFDNDILKRFGVILLFIYLPVCFISADNLVKMPMRYKQDEGLYLVSKYLEEQELDYGYATFWHANLIRLITDSNVQVRSIDLTNEGVVPTYYQSQKKWFEDQEGQTTYFLLLTDSEYRNLTYTNKKLINSANRILEFEHYKILIFEDNIF